MIKKIIPLFGLFIFSFFSEVHGSVIKNTEYFSKIGQTDSFRWAPSRYKNDFRYDIFYYIPKSVGDSQRVAALIFNHGGGASTMSREGSLKTINLYLPQLVEVAEALGVIIVLPSANGLNWGSHTRGLMRDLAALMKSHLNLDPDSIGLSGHSMGGMGITRSYSFIADEFSFFLPIAAGMDETIQTENHLNKVFNVPYVHLQGSKDNFQVFITRCLEQLKRVSQLEINYDRKSSFEVMFYDGDHQINYPLMIKTLKRLFNIKRNLYQKTLYGSLHTISKKITDNAISFDFDSEPRYFWIEIANFDLTTPEVIHFIANVRGNKIEINMPIYPQRSKELIIYLSQEMINLGDYIEVYLNGNLIKVREPSLPPAQVMDQRDPGFIFNDKLVISLH